MSEQLPKACSRMHFPEKEKPPPDATCWICLDGEAEGQRELEEHAETKADEQLHRRCACRGDAGFVHVTCLAKLFQTKVDKLYAETKCIGLTHLSDCPTCLEPYEFDFKRCLAEEYLKLTNELDESDIRNIYARLWSAVLSGVSNGANATKISRDKLLCVLKSIRSLSPEGKDFNMNEVVQLEVTCLVCLGEFCRRMDDMHGAVFYASSARALAVDNDLGTKNNTLLLAADQTLRDWEERGLIEHVNYSSETQRVIFEDDKELFGQNNALTLVRAFSLAEALVEEKKYQEGEELLRTNLPRAVQALGPTHEATVKLELRYAEVMGRLKNLVGARVFIKDDKDWSGRAAAVAPAISTSTGAKYVCSSILPNKQLIAALASSEEIVFVRGTPVKCHDVTKAKDRHINGKVGTIKSYHANKKQYEVKIDGDPHKHHMVKPENIEIVFNTIV